ncbi:response regulator [Cryobacterium sp. PH31-L1]|uniref:response regulator n=1 Tax=Cryobacterium sp. PH31-L1 TaxID=3046199 RepID=UPI0024BAC2C8|nr:response regulator [Cryobacterium sp. PH31-L1]MDJ0377776.1 response regulator [Cryobacterium sp. PH31-L1]
MSSFDPADNADYRVADDSRSDAAQGSNRQSVDDAVSSLSIEVLNRRLHDQQFYTRSLIESNIDSLMTTDTRGVITDVNQQMVDLTGRSRDELIGAPCRNFFTNPARADSAIARVIREDRLSDYELTVRSFDGTETVVSYNGSTLRNRERIVQGVFLAARDVTESKRFERALLEKNFKMEQTNISRAAYIKRARVEILTPLQSIVSSAEVLIAGIVGELSAAQQDRIRSIQAEGEYLLSLLHNVLGMSTIETGIVEFKYQDVNVQGILASCAAALNRPDKPPVNVQIDVASDVGSWALDSANVEKIIAILLSNAVIASPGGTVTVQARVVSRHDVGTYVGSRPSWMFELAESEFIEFLEFRVTDLGVGIAAEDLRTVFLPLGHRGSDPEWPSAGGGVGLALVKLLVELQNGTLGVDSTFGEGAAFTFWLPRRIAPIIEREVATPTSPIPSTVENHDDESAELAPLEPLDENGDSLLQHASKELIAAANADSNVDLQSLAEAVAGLAVPSGHSTALVVEDDPKSAKLVRLLLEAEGFRVIGAPSGEEALDLARRVPLSLITLDVQLPGMDGWKFLMKLHDSPNLASIPVVVIAGLTDMSLALSRGAAAVLEKPLQRVELQNSLTLLGLRPDRSHTRCILIVDEDSETVDQVTSYLEEPAYRVESSATGTAAIADALKLAPDLILINLMMEHLGGFRIVRALQEHESTQHIPVLVMSSEQITDEEQDTIDSDPAQPVVAMNKPDFNRQALLAEIKRALG